MKDRKKVKILLKVIERVYTKNFGMQKLVDDYMIDICKEEGVSLEQVLFCFSLLWFYGYGLSKHKFFACKGQLLKILGFIFSGHQEKKLCRVLWCSNFNSVT